MAKDDFRRPILVVFGAMMMISGAGMAGAFDRADQLPVTGAGNAPAQGERDALAIEHSDGATSDQINPAGQANRG